MKIKHFKKKSFSDETKLTLQFFYMMFLRVVTVESKLKTGGAGGNNTGYTNFSHINYINWCFTRIL